MKYSKVKMILILTISLVLIATTILLLANKFLPSIDISFNNNLFVNKLLKYQLLALILSLTLMFFTLKLTPQSKSLLSFGNVESVAIKEKWLGINGKSTWKINGLQLAFFISLATGIFMFIAVKYTNSLSNFQYWFIPVIIFISLTNSFSEEIIYRFVINGNLGVIAPKITILIISAILFGLPHYMGYPNGIAGVIMSAMLGYILSKATYETNGLGIALTIHFIQDLIIFTALFMMNIKK